MPTEPTPQSIKEILEKGKHVILKGPPGTGKTHLAMETIREFIGETGAQVSIVRHQMTVYFIANKGKSEGGSFNLSRSSTAKGDLGTVNSLYPPGENEEYFKTGEDAPGKSIGVKLFQYDGDEHRNTRDSYISTHLEFKNEGSGGSVQLRNVESNWIKQWDLLKLTRRIVVQNDAPLFEYHLHRYIPGSELHSEYTTRFLNADNAPEPKFGFPHINPPAGYEHLSSLKKKHRQMVTEVIPESFIVNSSVVWDIVQFHPTYSYSDFVRGVDPDFSDGEIRFSDQKRTFLKMCESAIQNPNTPHVLIVDEINRAALGSVFGELILGLEDEYKGIPILTGNGRRITIPKNLALLGTMNSSDRSIGVIDHALKRRFEWEVLPSVSNETESPVVDDDGGILVSEEDIDLLRELNNLLHEEVRKERGFGKWMIGKSGKCASVAFTIIPQLETLLREGELDSNQMKKAAEKISIWNESMGGDKYKVQITDFVGQHNPTWESIERIEMKHETPEGVEFHIKLTESRCLSDHPNATAMYNLEEDKWIVLKGSGICSPTSGWGVGILEDKATMAELLENKTIHLNEDDKGYFLKNWPADNPTHAARIPTRMKSAGGPEMWKLEDGTTYKQWLANLEVIE